MSRFWVGRLDADGLFGSRATVATIFSQPARALQRTGGASFQRRDHRYGDSGTAPPFPFMGTEALVGGGLVEVHVGRGIWQAVAV